MDNDRFDSLTRALGSGHSRRRILKTLAGGALAAVAAAVGLDRGEAAARCRAQGVVCSKNADCCSSVCLPRDRTGRQVCAECGSPADCPAAGDQCRAVSCQAGACVTAAISCDDGDACTTDACEPATGCVNTPVDCSALNGDCTTGTCDATSGSCVASPSNEGGACFFDAPYYPDALGVCANGACACKPVGAPCDCNDLPTVAGCCSTGCRCDPGTCV